MTSVLRDFEELNVDKTDIIHNLTDPPLWLCLSETWLGPPKMTRAAVNPQPLAMSHSAAGPAPAVQQSSEAGSSWEEILQEFQGRYKVASRMHCFQYNVGRKH